MLEKCRGIVLQTINYAENSVVLKCYTDRFGLQSYMVNGVKGKKAAIKPSQLMPLTLLELEVYHQQNKSLQRIKELKCVPVLNHLHFDLTKSTLTLFMAEVLNKCLKEENQGDDQLFGFLFSFIQMVDLNELSVANFPVFFLLRLSKYLGFFPKDNFDETHSDFSLQEGIFVGESPNTPEYCKGAIAMALWELLPLNFEQIRELNFPASVRRELLNKMIRYYQLHLMLFGDLKSPTVLHEVLNAG